MDNSKRVKLVSLCSGYEGIGIGLKRIIPSLRTIAYCERESYAIENILKKIEEGKLDAAPICTDVKSFPYRQFHGKVDIVTAGYPCQPFSVSGERQGENDERHLWPYIRDGIGLMRPPICFFENVEGHITMGLPTVISDLEELGYKVSWGIFSAAEIGASHERKRVFILAAMDDAKFEGLERLIWANLDQSGWEGQAGSNYETDICNWRRVIFGSELSDSRCCEPRKEECEYIEVGGVVYGRRKSKWPNYPTEPQKDWEPKRLITESESKLAGNRNGLAHRVDRHILIGNGVVPDVASRAFYVLWYKIAGKQA